MVTATKRSTIYCVDRIDWTGEQETVQEFHTKAEAEQFAKDCRRSARIDRRDERPKYVVCQYEWVRDA